MSDTKTTEQKKRKPEEGKEEDTKEKKKTEEEGLSCVPAVENSLLCLCFLWFVCVCLKNYGA
jgi:hypothetical protein